MRARDRARTLRRKKTNSQRHVYSHTPQTYLQHTRNTHASEEIQMHLDKLLKQQQKTGFSGEQKLTWHNTSAQRTAAQHSSSHFYWKWMNAKRLYKTLIYVPLWWYFIVWSLWRIITSIKPQNVLKKFINKAMKNLNHLQALTKNTLKSVSIYPVYFFNACCWYYYSWFIGAQI